MKQCEDYELAISCYVDGELGPKEVQEVFGHLAQCEACSGFLGATIRIRIDAAKEVRQRFVGSSPAPPRFEPGAGAPIASRHRVMAMIRRRIPIPVPVAAAAIILLFFFTLTLNQQTQEKKPAPVVHPPLPEQITTLPVVRIP